MSTTAARARGLRPMAWVVAAAVALAAAACGSDETSGAGGSAVTGGAGASSSGGGSGGTAGGTTSSGGAAGGASGGGQPGAGQVIVDPTDPAWLRYQGAGSFFLAAPGDPEGFLYRGTRQPDGTRDGDQQAIIDKLAPTGANGIYLMAVRSHGGDGGPTENPFEGSDPTGPLDQDILSQWEGWFTAMDDAGIVVFFFFYDDSARIWDTGDTVGPDEQAFLTALVDRYEHHDHLIWCIGEEYSEKYSAARASAIAAAIRAADDRDHVIAIHQLTGLTFDFPDDPNIDQFAIQYNVGTPGALHSGMVQAFADAAGRYNLNMAEAAAWGSGASARRKAWAVAMGGAYVMALGFDIANNAQTDLEDLGRLRAFMESVELAGMAPHDEIGFSGTEHVLAAPPDRYLLYSSALAGDLGARSLTGGSYQLHWLDIATGQAADETVSVAGGDTTLPAPPAMGSEVALRLVRQ